MEKTQNNKGFSLVELIVIVAIIAVLATIVSLSSGFVGKAKVKAAAQTIEAMVNRCKEENLNGLDCYVYIKSSGKYVALVRTSDSSIIAQEYFQLPVKIQTSSTGSAKTLKLKFDETTGAKLKDYGSTTYYISISSINTTVYKLSINELTGATTLTRYK